MTLTSMHAVHPSHYVHFTTSELRSAFHITGLFVPDEIAGVYTHFDRLIVGGALPSSRPLKLETHDSLKAQYFLERRELGIINVGNTGSVRVDGTTFTLKHKEALYVGRGTKEVIFEPAAETARYYFNSAPAHASYPTRKVSLEEADTVEIGSINTSNHRVIRKLLVNSVLQTCQLQMGLTELQQGSVWNTMPPHTHERRMEAYFYFNIPEGNAV